MYKSPPPEIKLLDVVTVRGEGGDVMKLSCTPLLIGIINVECHSILFFNYFFLFQPPLPPLHTFFDLKDDGSKLGGC